MKDQSTEPQESSIKKTWERNLSNGEVERINWSGAEIKAMIRIEKTKKVNLARRLHKEAARLKLSNIWKKFFFFKLLKINANDKSQTCLCLIICLINKSYE